MGKAIIFAGLLLAAVPASAQPYCWWDSYSYSLQCSPQYYEWGNPRRDHWRREQWHQQHQEWEHRHREERR